MTKKSHFVIVDTENGEPEQIALKKWIRDNLNILPEEFYTDNDTSHILRRKLVKQLGWKMNETDTSVFVVKPDKLNKFEYAENYVDEIIEDEETEFERTEDAFEITLSLEKDLQASLRKNIETLEVGLSIIDEGKERHTVAGRIDITAKDRSDSIVIIELKAIEAKADVIAQTLSYMEAVKQEENKNVRGIIIASDFPERVKLAARQIPNLKLVKYAFQFNFNQIQ